MEQTWRWFGPTDRVTLRDAKEAGAESIVTALHEVPSGEVWGVNQIELRKREIEATGLTWNVVESLNVSETVKMRGPGWQCHVENFRQSLRNLAACGINTVTYNWMPLFSWMRTHLHAPAPGGGLTTRFDAAAFAAFDLFLLKRKAAELEWDEDAKHKAHTYLQCLTDREKDELQATILSGLPGGNGSYTLQSIRELLTGYTELEADGLRENLGEFLRAVCPVAAELGMTLCIHPDDPPRSLLGLPRVVSTAADLDWLLRQWDTKACGIAFCSGALGVRPDNDLVAIVRRFAPRIGFLHLRSTQREGTCLKTSGGEMESFFEAAHLEGDADLIGIIVEMVKEERRRFAAGEKKQIPFRADHGHELLNDWERVAAPGYPAVGRLRGLAELRGAIRMAERLMTEVGPNETL